MNVENKRKDERFEYEMPDFVYAEFKHPGKPESDDVVNLDVADCSKYGLGMVVKENNIELLNHIKIGDRVEGLSFYASWTMIKVNGIIKHITKMESDQQKNWYVIGIESPDIIDSCQNDGE